MTEGYVYILSNPSMPGLVKIGKTTGSPDDRAAQLYVTGVPTPFVVEFSCLSPDCGELEKFMHDFYAEKRLAGGREFFEVSPLVAIGDLEAHLEWQIKVFTENYLPSHILAGAEYCVSPETVSYLANTFDETAIEVADALSFVTKDEMSELIRRSRERRAILKKIADDGPVEGTF